MGAGKRLRRSVKRHLINDMLASLAASTPIYVGPAGERDGIEYEFWRVGPVLTIQPTLSETMRPEVLYALDRRRRAFFTGRCDCGAAWRVTGDANGLVLDHEHDCVAGDDRLRELLGAST